MYKWNWLATVLKNAGVKVIEEDGWQTRGHGDVETCKGICCHHTGTPSNRNENMPTLHMVINGRSDLAGPLCNLALGRDGTAYIVAAGKAYHAGAGSWKGITNGNSVFVGIEAENVGNGKDPWPQIQMEAYTKICAAILDHCKLDTIYCIGHKEWAPKRKVDPTFDMNQFRTNVDKFRSK